MSFRLYHKTQDAWRGMEEAIAGATKSIFWECYILADDPIGQRFFNLLAAKAREGVTVKIIIDSIGSFSVRTSTVRRLTSAGVEVLFFNRLMPWRNPHRWHNLFLFRNHRKILVIDGQRVFIGGVNIGEPFADWFDLQMLLTGRSVVAHSIRSFAKTYRWCGGKDHLFVPVRSHRGRLPLLHLKFHWPRLKGSPLYDLYKEQLTVARESVIIVTPYFIPHPRFFRKLKSTLKRGVRVELMIPKDTGSRVLNIANRVFAQHAAHLGTHVILSPTMNHAKAVVLDHEAAVVGSPNIDAMSFDYNLEANVIIRNKRIVARLNAIVNRWRHRATPFHLHTDQTRSKRWYQRSLDKIIALLQPIL